MSQGLREQLLSKWQLEWANNGGGFSVGDTLVETLIDDVCALREALKNVYHNEHDPGHCRICDTMNASTARLKSLGVIIDD